MRKQLVSSVEKILNDDINTVLLLGDIGVFGFRNSFKNHPNRTYNIGILEQSTISLSAGMSKTGLIPFVHTIAPFLVERAFEQLKIDFGYQNLNGNFISVGASYDYASLGCTHHCPGDVNILYAIPNMEILLPGTSQELDSLINECYNNGNPTYYRLSEHENDFSNDVKVGRANLIKKGNDATIICFGNSLNSVIESTKNMDVTILYYTSVRPFDGDLLLANFNQNIIIVEPFYEGSVNFEVTKTLKDKKYSLYNIGVPREFIMKYGKKEEVDKFVGLDQKSINENINKILCQI